MQVVNTNAFRSNQTNRVFNIYHTLTYKSQWIIYLLECILYNVGKSETSFNIRLKNHRKGMNNSKAIPACVHFRKKGYKLIQYAKLTLTLIWVEGGGGGNSLIFP